VTAPKTYPCPHPQCERAPAYNYGGCLHHLLQLPLPIRDRFTKVRMRTAGDPRGETWEDVLVDAVRFWEALP
jgi:hypothetical protein